MKNAFMVIAVLLCAVTATATTVGERLVVTQAGAYCQIQDASQGFELRRFRPFFTANHDSLSVFAEAQVGKSTFPLQAYIDYRVTLPLIGRSKLRLGEFTNPMMYIESPPGKKQFVTYALTDYYVQNQYDIGVALLLQNRLGSLQACVINGSGLNSPDDNKSRDLVFAVKTATFGPLQFSGAYQSGCQPTGQRELYFGKATITPVAWLTAESAILWREDFQNGRGWLVTAVADLTEAVALTGRLTQRTQHAQWIMAQGQLVTDDIEGVVGAEFRQGALRLQPNLVLQRHKSPAIVWAVQFDLSFL